MNRVLALWFRQIIYYILLAQSYTRQALFSFARQRDWQKQMFQLFFLQTVALTLYYFFP